MRARTLQRMLDGSRTPELLRSPFSPAGHTRESIRFSATRTARIRPRSWLDSMSTRDGPQHMHESSIALGWIHHQLHFSPRASTAGLAVRPAPDHSRVLMVRFLRLCWESSVRWAATAWRDSRGVTDCLRVTAAPCVLVHRHRRFNGALGSGFAGNARRIGDSRRRRPLIH